MKSKDERNERFAALVVYNDPGARDLRAIAAKEAQKAFKTKSFINIREMIYLSVLDIYVAIVQLPTRKKEKNNGKEKKG